VTLITIFAAFGTLLFEQHVVVLLMELMIWELIGDVYDRSTACTPLDYGGTSEVMSILVYLELFSILVVMCARQLPTL
jgi:hypothetical protein